MAGAIFLGLQLFEYIEAPFTISSSVYGSIFYLATGFHGFHVAMGLTFILICFFRQIAYHFTCKHHIGFEAASWYWHFVDVVWIFLFLSIYWWGS
jgi:cytochrome c oxidase subunit 3